MHITHTPHFLQHHARLGKPHQLNLDPTQVLTTVTLGKRKQWELYLRWCFWPISYQIFSVDSQSLWSLCLMGVFTCSEFLHSPQDFCVKLSWSRAHWKTLPPGNLWGLPSELPPVCLQRCAVLTCLAELWFSVRRQVMATPSTPLTVTALLRTAPSKDGLKPGQGSLLTCDHLWVISRFQWVLVTFLSLWRDIITKATF